MSGLGFGFSGRSPGWWGGGCAGGLFPALADAPGGGFGEAPDGVAAPADALEAASFDFVAQAVGQDLVGLGLGQREPAGG